MLSRASIAFALFPDDAESLARNSLRRNLSYLLSSLPDAPKTTPFVRADARSICWNSEAPAIVDIDDFAQAIADGRDADAVEIYRGELLPSIYAEWTIADRGRLRAQCNDALLRELQRYRSLRQFDEASTVARTLLNEDPWREDVIRLLMTIRYEAGDRSGALAEFDRFAGRLRLEMRTEPMPETLAVRETVLRGAVLATSERSRARRGAELQPALALPLVGRDDAMESAMQNWRRAAEGPARLLVVAGDAGIGKSRFVTELARAIERAGGQIGRGNTSPGEERYPYEAFAEALRAWPKSELAERLFDEPDAAMLSDDRSSRIRLFEQVRRAIANLARSRPLTLILEDLHWSGRDTAALLEFVTVRLGPAPALVVVTTRTDELGRGHPLRRIVSELNGRGIAEVLTLQRLSAADATKAVTTLAPEADEALIREAVGWADGVPLLLLEAARDLAAGRRAIHADVGALVGERFARLTTAAATVLVYAAAVGNRFELATLAAAMGWSDAAIVDALTEAVDLGLVRAADNIRGIAFAFGHHVLHAAAYERIERADRPRAHAMVARALSALAESETSGAAETARQFQAAGESGRAAAYWCRAAQYALSIFANEDALAAASHGLNLVDEAPALRFDLLSLREDATRRLGGLLQRRADSIALLACASDDPKRRCLALERVFDSHRDDPVERRRALDQLAELAQLGHEYAAVYDRALCQDAYMCGDYGRARDAALRASLRFERLGDERSAMLARFRYIGMLGMLDDFSGADMAIATLRARFEESEDAPLATEFYRVASSAVGDHRREEALADSRRSLELALRTGDRYAQARAHQNVATFLGKLRKLAESERHNEAALEAFRDVDDAEGIDGAALNLCASQAWRGNFAGALRTLEALRPDPLPAHEIRAEFVRGIIDLRQGNPESAIAHFTAARQRAIELKLPLRVARANAFLAETWWLAGDHAKARCLLDEALTQLPQLGQPGLCAELRALSARFYARAGDRESALADAQICLDLLEIHPIQDRSQATWFLATAYALADEDETAMRFAADSARAFVEDALQMDAHGAELYSALSWHQQAMAFLFGRGLPPTD